jgi:hypothetical protein
MDLLDTIHRLNEAYCVKRAYRSRAVIRRRTHRSQWDQPAERDIQPCTESPMQKPALEHPEKVITQQGRAPK